jgi:hypothetical protein
MIEKLPLARDFFSDLNLKIISNVVCEIYQIKTGREKNNLLDKEKERLRKTIMTKIMLTWIDNRLREIDDYNKKKLHYKMWNKYLVEKPFPPQPISRTNIYDTIRDMNVRVIREAVRNFSDKLSDEKRFLDHHSRVIPKTVYNTEEYSGLKGKFLKEIREISIGGFE